MKEGKKIHHPPQSLLEQLQLQRIGGMFEMNKMDLEEVQDDD
jgi:hypothetical protein